MGDACRMTNKNTPLEFIKNDTLNEALQKEYRQYLAGKLTREQKHLKHIDDDIEVGVSLYKEFTADKPHKHPVATEHGYVLQGSVKVKLLDGSGREYQFNEGDFFVLRTNIGYATKNAKNTKILFIKSPGINDKTLVDVDTETEKWLSSWD